MTNKAWIFPFSFALLVFALFLTPAALTQPVSANPQPQVVYQTPTAMPDGRILYIVQPNDTCLRIQLLTNVTVEQLRLINKLDDNCTLSVGKELILGFVTPVATVTPNPEITVTPLLPTPTPFKGNGQICVMLFNDVNGNAFYEESESLIGGGAVSITNRREQVSETGSTTTDPTALFCKDVPEGEYSVSIAVPDGHNATNETNVSVPVQAGDQVYVDFGAQISTKAIENQPETPSSGSGESNNTMLAILGGLFLLLGLGLGLYVVFMRRS